MAVFHFRHSVTKAVRKSMWAVAANPAKRSLGLGDDWTLWECWIDAECIWHYNEQGKCVGGARPTAPMLTETTSLDDLLAMDKRELMDEVIRLRAEVTDREATSVPGPVVVSFTRLQSDMVRNLVRYALNDEMYQDQRDVLDDIFNAVTAAERASA
jgi:hypothetical protein